MERNAPYRFKKGNRLLDAASFERVFEKANRSRDKWFTVLSRPNSVKIGRLGLAISKKLCKEASERNRIKRVIRESFRQHQSLLEGLDIIVINGQPAAAAVNKELYASLATHWQRCRNSKKNNDTPAELD